MSRQLIQQYAASQLAGIYTHQLEYAELWLKGSNKSKEYNMNVHRAQHIAESLKSQLEPFCSRIEIAGSISREKPEVKDIEIVCIPKTETIQKDIFESEEVVLQGFQQLVNSWTKVKGEPTGKYTQRIITFPEFYPEAKTGDVYRVTGGTSSCEIKLDLFMCKPENWGYISAIRTGSADFSHLVLASTWKAKGYRGLEGMLAKGMHLISVPEQKDLFELLELPYLNPNQREIDRLPPEFRAALPQTVLNVLDATIKGKGRMA